MGRLDGGRLVGGVFVAVVVFAVPAWFGLARAGGAGRESLALAHPTAGAGCVLPPERMRAMHPSLLSRFRDLAVRQGERSWRTEDGRSLTIDLTGSCLGCHGSGVAFCDPCHENHGVTLSCWGCHAKSPPLPALPAAPATAPLTNDLVLPPVSGSRE